MFVLDKWTDSMCKSRISVQLQVPSGSDSASKMDVRVSTDQRALVIVFPMSPFLAHSDFTFKNLVKDLPRFKSWGEDAVSYILQNHAKIAAKIKSIVILKERLTTKQFLFSLCADGAWMMHAELVVDVGHV
eukprot:11646953-Ditylum_brightwellii.AAC.1